jgi:hypothetical protein
MRSRQLVQAILEIEWPRPRVGPSDEELDRERAGVVEHYKLLKSHGFGEKMAVYHTGKVFKISRALVRELVADDPWPDD